MSSYSCMPALMAATEYLLENKQKINKIMEKERKVTAPDGCEIEKVEIVDGAAVVTFREKERKLPKSWEDFCEMFPIQVGECYIDNICGIIECIVPDHRGTKEDKNLLSDRATAEAVLALCQLIQLRECYNGDWVPDYRDKMEDKYVIEFFRNEKNKEVYQYTSASPLYFKTRELRDEFLKYFGDLIEKLKPLYGIKEGGGE